jgi:diacylglycerol kinase family enzyme
MYMQELETLLLMSFNGKYGGGGMLLNPLAVINDGLLDVTLVPGK